MKSVYIIVIFLTQLYLCTAANITIECPTEVYINQLFECEINASNITKTYDLKLELLYNEENIIQIWNEEKQKFKSSYYYLENYITKNNQYKISIKILYEIDSIVQAKVKLRNNTKIDTFDYDIKIQSIKSEDIEELEDTEEEIPEINNEIKIKNSNNELERIENIYEEEPPETIQLNQPQKVINLNSHQKITQDPIIIYESNGQKARRYALYTFVGFLFLILGYMLWEKYGNSKYDY